MDKCYVVLGVLLFTCISYLTIFIVTTEHSTSAPTLVKVFIAFRHGNRAPIVSYQNDPYNKDDEKYWPDGPGELTKAGKYEAYELGRLLRARYKDFVGSYYRPQELRAFSNLKERAMMSAQLVLAGIFPPRGYQQWNLILDWQPVPVYPDSINNDTNGINCPYFTAELQKMIPEHASLDLGLTSKEISLLQENTGHSNVLLAMLSKVWDATYFQDRAELPLPDWLRTMYPHKMATVALRFCKLYLSGSHYQRMLVLGPLAEGLYRFFSESSRKIELHSWYELNIMSLLIMLGVEVDTFPEPSCAVAIELHNNGEEYFEVYYYPNSKATQPRQLMILCGTSCSLSHLKNISRLYTLEDYGSACYSRGLVSDSMPKSKLGF